jgi:hypothetical protein
MLCFFSLEQSSQRRPDVRTALLLLPTPCRGLVPTLLDCALDCLEVVIKPVHPDT